MKERSLVRWVGGGAAIVIVLASILARQIGQADGVANVGEQRAAVARFHKLVRDERWAAVYELMTEPPTRDAASFAKLMGDQRREHGDVTQIRTRGMRLLRSRTVPMLEVRETVTTTSGEIETVSYFARRGERWLFAFSAPA